MIYSSPKLIGLLQSHGQLLSLPRVLGPYQVAEEGAAELPLDFGIAHVSLMAHFLGWMPRPHRLNLLCVSSKYESNGLICSQEFTL